ncbi:MAG TPA: tetratricopeptide repeat protein [Kofleriaceae bacterium]|nr:tetratricopeptide repeat protein [Kofleriaceae bacterium]
MSQSDFVSRGQALVSAGQYQEAVKVCRLGLLGRPTTVEGRIVLGQALLALKRFDEVLAEMRVALELDHGSLPAQILKGEALLRKGDAHGAIDVLARARDQAPGDGRLRALIGEAERAAGRPNQSASHASVAFVQESTKHYPNHGADEEDTSDEDGVEDTGGSFTRPTSLAAPQAKKKTPRPTFSKAAVPEATPPPSVLAVGDRSGTVEVDPELDGVEMNDDDFGELASPPASRQRPVAIGGARGQVVATPARGRGKLKHKSEISTVELDDQEMVEVDEETLSPPDRDRPRKQPSPGSAVRNAVKMPSGPLEPRPATAASRPTHIAPAVAPPPHLAQVIAQPAPLPPPPRNPIAAALPTAAAMPVPPPGPPPGMAHAPMPLGPPMQQPYGAQPHPFSSTLPAGGGVPPASAAAAARPTMALSPAQQQTAAAVDAMFEQQHQPYAQQSPAWARSTVAAPMQQMPMQQMPMQQMPPQQMPPQQMHQPYSRSPDELTSRPNPVPYDPALAMYQAPGVAAVALPDAQSPSQSGRAGSSKGLKTGMRRGRSKLQIVIWALLGAAVIGGGVFAGFQIRAMRLEKQITAAREQAVALAKADTWKGWIGARDRLAGIAQASATLDNRAALARTRSLVAFEFGDGIAPAKAAVTSLAGVGGLDGELAIGFLALAEHDAKVAKNSADRALEISAKDPAALYVAGRAALLNGDAASAIRNLKAAAEAEPRPMYLVGLARAYREASDWKSAGAALDKALAASPEHPGALIERGLVLAASGQIQPGSKASNDLRAQLQKIATEGTKQLAEQPRGVSPLQVALANLALTEIDYMRGDVAAMQADFRAALIVNLDDQQFAEQTIETLYEIGDLGNTKKTIDQTLAHWPNNKRARIWLARVLLAQGQHDQALETINKLTDIKDQPQALAVRGEIALAGGDLEAARNDFEAALKKSPTLESAIVGRTWVDLQAGDITSARVRIDKRQTAMATPAITTAYAATLRLGGDASAREDARKLLEKVVAGAPGPDIPRAQLELARIYREIGDLRSARAAYAEASRTGSQEARLEAALLQIDDRDPSGGRDTLDQLIKAAGDHPAPQLLLEGARARMLVGDHPGATALLDQADKLPGVTRWQLDRERGRLALRRGDLAKAGAALARALESCGDDTETFLLAAEVAAADEKQDKLAERIKALAAKQLKGKPEAKIVTGKLLLSRGEDAAKAYEEARLALKDQKASPRRMAQAHLGSAIVAYNKQDDPVAIDALSLAIDLDPSLYAAYLYYADIVKTQDPKKALEQAQKAVVYNPELLDAYGMVGALAAKLGNRKLLDEQIAKVKQIAPGSEVLRQLQSLR